MSTVEFDRQFNNMSSLLNAFAYNLTKNVEDAKDESNDGLSELKEFFNHKNMDIQLTPAGIHQRNAAE